MDNIGDALKMAGSVLLFILALSLIIPLFTQARQTADAIMDFSDRQAVTEGIDEDSDLESNYFYQSDTSRSPTQARQVGVNDIVATIYRAFDEDFKVVFVTGGSNVRQAQPLNIYKWVGGNASDTTTAIDKRPVNTIELKNSSVGNGDDEKKGFLKGILYADYSYTKNNTDLVGTDKSKFQDKFKVELGDFGVSGSSYYGSDTSNTTTDKGLVGYLNAWLSGNVIEEYLGVYYQADLDVVADSATVVDEDYRKVPESMKNDRRVVTYYLK